MTEVTEQQGSIWLCYIHKCQHVENEMSNARAVTGVQVSKTMA